MLNVYFKGNIFTSVECLFQRKYFYGIDFNPDYQRDYVWDLQDKILLIDSIFNNVKIGHFAFADRGCASNVMYEVIDGKQRLDALSAYYEDRFEYNGKFFSELSKKDQHHFKNYSVQIMDIQNATKEQILRYFILLNIAGKVMDKEHLNIAKEELQRIQADKENGEK